MKQPSKILRRWLSPLLFTASAMLVGCGADDSNTLKIGVIAGLEASVMQVAIDIAKKESNLDAEMIEFSDYVSPNVALSDGSLDVNAFQHKPYLEAMIENRGFKLVAVADTFIYPIAAYSKKIKSMNALKNGAKIAVPNDPSNEGRAMLLLHNNGFIKLKDPKNLEATPADIIENPHNYSFIELDAAQLPRSLDDVDLAIINNTFAASAGFTPKDNGLLVEHNESPYMNVMVSREDNKDDPRIQQLIKAYQTDAVIKKADELFKGSSIPGWK